jgi:hypothetical protein
MADEFDFGAWSTETEDWSQYGVTSPQYKSQPAMSPQSFNPESDSWEKLLRDGIRAASSVYIAREQIQAGQAANAGRMQSPWAMPIAPGQARSGGGMLGGMNLTPLLWLAAAGAVALLILRR